MIFRYMKNMLRSFIKRTITHPLLFVQIVFIYMHLHMIKSLEKQISPIHRIKDCSNMQIMPISCFEFFSCDAVNNVIHNFARYEQTPCQGSSFFKAEISLVLIKIDRMLNVLMVVIVNQQTSRCIMNKSLTHLW